MKEIQLTKKLLNISQLKNDEKDVHYDMVLCGDFLAYEDNELKFAYLVDVGIDTTKYLETIDKIKFLENQTRSNGMKTTSRTIGYLPRNSYRRDYCSVSKLAVDQPKEHDVVCELAEIADNVYKKYFETKHKYHRELDNKVLPELHIENTVFTSGIINKSSSLGYHYDKGNFKNVLSAMITLKRDISGGYLVLPEYELAIECANDSILLFDGQNMIHGVNNICKQNENSQRYTIVFYSMFGMWECLPIEQELDRVKILETQHEIEKVEQ